MIHFHCMEKNIVCFMEVILFWNDRRFFIVWVHCPFNLPSKQAKGDIGKGKKTTFEFVLNKIISKPQGIKKIKNKVITIYGVTPLISAVHESADGILLQLIYSVFSQGSGSVRRLRRNHLTARGNFLREFLPKQPICVTLEKQTKLLNPSFAFVPSLPITA